MVKLITLKKRSDFLRLRDAGFKAVRSDFVLQAAPSVLETPDTIYLGFTATKKLGNAVVRNRTKRRLRAVAQAVFPEHARVGVDYVLIGRKNTVQTPYDTLCRDLQNALMQIDKRINAAH